MNKPFALTALAAAISLAAPLAQADTVTYTLSSVAQGVLGGVAFGLSDVTLIAVADTLNITVNAPGITLVTHSSAQISISGLGTFSFDAPTQSFFNANVSVLGFSPVGGLDLWSGGPDPALVGWTLGTAIGPVALNYDFLQWLVQGPISVGGQVLSLDTALAVPGTFQASVFSSAVPEPSVLSMLAVAAAGLALLKARRRHA